MTGYVFKDTESTGTDTRFDQILQFAGIRTDADLNELEAVNVRCRRLPHVIPSPIALKVTNVDPWSLTQAPMSPYEMACFIHGRYQAWLPATVLGHNTLGFDEEIERSTFWMNLQDPYITNGQGSARADTLVMLRAACALQPDLLKIRIHPEKGSPIFKLDVLAPDNGFEGHQAHDALGDIRANIFLAKILKSKAPAMWDALMANTKADAVETLIGNPLVLLMTHFGNPEFLPATKIAMNPKNKRQALMLDLSKDFAPWLEKSAEEIAAGIFTKESPFQTIKTNAQPTVFASTDPVVAAKWADVTAKTTDVAERLRMVTTHPTFHGKCLDALKIKADSFPPATTIEEQIYGGSFPTWADKNRMKDLHKAATWEERQTIAAGFKDARMKAIFERLLWSEAPHLLQADRLGEIDATMVRERVLGKPEGETRWSTIAKARTETAGLEGHPLGGQITSWFDALEQAVTADPAAVRSFAASTFEGLQATLAAA